MTLRSGLLTSMLCASSFVVLPAQAHGIVGNRVFPATLQIEDPAVQDELTLPQVSTIKRDGERETDYSAEFSKKITSTIALSVEGAYIDGDEDSGFDNVGVGAKYQALTNAEHEIMASVGLDYDIGNTGKRGIGEDYSTLTPALFVGKGFGDLPDSVPYLKPFALTGQFGYEAALDRDHDDDDALTYGFTVQYSLPYLQQHVKDMGWAAPFDNLVPIVEFAFETPTDQGKTTGTINPGVIWTGQTVQLGLEAMIPVNDASGDDVGVTAQLHFYLDDLFGR